MVVEERCDLIEEGSEWNESLFECGSMRDCCVKKVSSPVIGEAVAAVMRRRRWKKTVGRLIFGEETALCFRELTCFAKLLSMFVSLINYILDHQSFIICIKPPNILTTWQHSIG